MPLSDSEINELLLSVTTRDEKLIATSVFGVESVLREVITLIASHPEKLQNIGGPIKAVERVPATDSITADADDDQQVFNVEVSVTADREQQEIEWMEGGSVMTTDQEEIVPGVVVVGPSSLQDSSMDIDAALPTARSSRSGKSSMAPTVYACPHCNKEFLRVFELQRHIVVKHTKDKKYKCDVCGQMFALQMYLNNHMRTKHLPKQEKPYGCRLCNYRCIIKSMLTRHMEVHARDKSFQCPDCDMSFSRLALLERHSYKHREKTLSCTHCDYKTANPYQLTAHTKMHTSNIVYSCTQCSFTANTKTELNKHSLIHSEEIYTCTECGLVFKRVNSLKRHQYVHMEKNIVCDICEWRTADPYEFKRHQREHDEGKKHVCEKCGFGFARMFDLKKHLRIHEKVHMCKQCGRTFTNSHELTCHKRRRHTKFSKPLPEGSEDSNEAITEDQNKPTAAGKKGQARSLLSSTSASASNETESDHVVEEEQEVQTEAETVTEGDAEGEMEGEVEEHTQTVIIRSNGEQIILPAGVQIVNENGTPYIPVKGDESADHQLLQMASAIIAQVDESTSNTQVAE